MTSNGDAEEIAREVFSTLGINNPYLEQLEVFNHIYLNAKKGVAPFTFVKLPCGYGKTESAIAPFFAQFSIGEWYLAPRMIYVLPTQALCQQIKNRITEKVSRINPKLVVESHHGSHPLDAYFFSDVVVTTLDQFLYGYVRTYKHLISQIDLPAGSIALSYVVFDEAHMYSPYTHALMRAMIEILNKSNVPFTLMTATMPDSLCNDFKRDLINLKEVSYKRGKVIERSLSVEIKNEELVPNNTDNSALKEAEDGERVLVVCNTVGGAIKFYNKIKERRDDVVLIHARFTVSDRNDKEEKIIEKLGKKGSGGIVVSTQVCEVGLDISADILLTECAPADSLIQRIGRCARWERANEISRGKVIIYKARDFPPYFEKHLSDTWEYLNKNKVDSCKIDFTDWTQVCGFVNLMEYHVDNYQARHALNDLYESTLFADNPPREFSAREEKYLQLLITDAKEINKLSLEDFKKRLIALDFRYALHLIGNKGKRVNWEDGQFKVEDYRVYPFQTYIWEQNKYSSEIGLVIEE